MSRISYTVERSGTYFYNRRVPKESVDIYGSIIRVRLGSDVEQVKLIANRITNALNRSFVTGYFIDVRLLVEAMKPKVHSLTEIAEEYVELRDIDRLSPRLAVELLISVAGDLPVEDYSRDDARAFVKALELKGSATATIRRRINSISAILNYAYAEKDIDKRNPFSRIIIKGEGKDRKKRGTFSIGQLQDGYAEALSSKSQVRLLFPILGETGCRIGEIVGLRVDDVDLNQGVIHIRPHAHRRLKTTGSERSLPLVGYAEKAMRAALNGSDGQYVFPRYFRPQGFVSTHASNALNKWTKDRFNGLTAHCLRHTMRDRLRAVEAPLEMIDQIGGWTSINTMGSKYGQGYDVEQLRKWFSKVVLWSAESNADYPN
jgi:integrase